MYAGEKVTCTLSAAESISLLLKFLLVCIVWSAVASFAAV